METRNNVWFVTGASKGLGLSLVQRLLKEGHKVAATSRNKAALIDAVGTTDDSFLALEMNLTDEESVKAAVSEATSKFKGIDVLVNNAGYGQLGTVEELSDKEARKNFDTNVFGLLNVTRAVLPVMRKLKSGHIMNISSVGGYLGGFAGWGIYCSTKFAVAGLTEALHAELKEFGIRVTLVYPGYFRTNFLESDSLSLPEKGIPDYVEARKSQELHTQKINKNQPGDPLKAAEVMINISKEAHPPLHLLLGSDAYGLVQAETAAFNKDVEAWKKVTLSTDL